MGVSNLSAPLGQPLRIRCAICDRQVDRYEWWTSPCAMTRTLVVHCHGDNNRMTLTCFDAAEMGRDELKRMTASEGVAFTTRRLPSSEPHPAGIPVRRVPTPETEG